MGEKYEPTPHLRFVKREIPRGEAWAGHVRILQQLWVDRGDLSFYRVECHEHYESVFHMQHEWRDVPEVEE
jgi:hypothetical protein